MADAGVQAPLHKNKKATLPRIENFISSERFKEVNLVNRLYKETTAASLSYWSVPGGEGAWQQWTFDEVISQTFKPTSVGESFGPTWTTHWFKVDLTLPASWTGEEVRFRWDSGSEAMIYSTTGQILQGLSSTKSDQYRTDYVITESYDGSTPSLTFYVEMAANRILGTTDGDLIDPPPTDMMFTLERAEVSLTDSLVYKLIRDLEILSQFANEMSEDSRGYAALFTANQMVNDIIAGNDQSASQLADAHFAKGNGARAHTMAAIGNCHIDTAWLWPYSETKRKAARSFSSQLVLMDKYPDYIFVASQAQQWAWVKEYYPELFERIKVRVAEGRFIPVGSTWIEMDGNIPSGESFVRQFLHGQKWYQKELGMICKEYWLPDTFGYSPQIPGIMKHMGLTRFLTQKMSWNFVNKFPHNNFTWEGIDGSKVLAHFPPGDSYGMRCDVKEVVYSETNMKDKGRVSTSAYLFGYGDGGGGPTQDMLEKANRLTDMDGCPKMQKMTPDQMFTILESEQHNFCQWTGELYLELHNGTYTSQAAMKRLCRQSEFKLREAEFMLCCASIGDTNAQSLLSSSLVTLDEAWKKVLLNQFHDVLPGSGIEIIYEDATTYYQEAIAAATSVYNNSLAQIFGESGSTKYAVNTLQWPRTEVIHSGDESTYQLVTVPPFGYALATSVTPSNPVTVVEENGNYVLSNGLVRAVINSTGQIVSLTTSDSSDRDVFVAPSGDQSLGNKLLLFDDEPLYWDAWDVMDYHLETETCINNTVSSPVIIKSSSPLRCSLSWGCTVGKSSTMTQEIILTADCPYVTFDTSVNWSENRKLLKVGFDTSIKTNKVTYETQFGHLERPTSANTSWETAKYEVCGHKWADISDPSFGMAILNESKYGWSGRYSSVTLTLLKSPKAPDANCDMRQHSFSYAVMPHAGSLREAGVVQRAYEFNNPMKLESLPTATDPSNSWFEVLGEGVVLHTIKPAEDGSGDVILRLYEGHGTYSSVELKINFPVANVKNSDGMETEGEDIPFTTAEGSSSVSLSLTAFEIKALRVSFSSN